MKTIVKSYPNPWHCSKPSLPSGCWLLQTIFSPIYNCKMRVMLCHYLMLILMLTWQQSGCIHTVSTQGKPPFPNVHLNGLVNGDRVVFTSQCMYISLELWCSVQIYKYKVFGLLIIVVINSSLVGCRDVAVQCLTYIIIIITCRVIPEMILQKQKFLHIVVNIINRLFIGCGQSQP